MNGTRSRTLSSLFLLPSTIFIVVFSVIPIIMMFFFSFTEYNVINSPKFIGFQNYRALLDDIFFMPALINTLLMTIIIVPIQTFLSLFFASIFARKAKGIFDSFIKSALFVPVIASPILVGAVWKNLYDPNAGEINALLSFLSIPELNWLGDTSLALISVSIVTIWKNVGYFMVIYLAAILEIPKSYYEASELDGASGFKKLIYITLPSIRPTTYFVIIIGLIWTFQSFEIIYTMTGGGPGTATITIVYNIYNAGFKFFQMGYASAISVVLFLIILISSIIQKKLLSL